MTIAIAVTFYLLGIAVMVAWAVQGRSDRRHRLDIAGTRGVAVRTIASVGMLMRTSQSIVLLMIAGLLFLMEAQVFMGLASAIVPELNCEPGLVPSSACVLIRAPLEASQTTALKFAMGTLVLLVTSQIVIERRAAFPLVALVGVVILFAAMADIIASPNETAKGGVILGAISFLQAFCAIALWGALSAIKPLRYATVVKVLGVAAVSAAIRLSGCVAIVLLSQILPPATTIALLLLGLQLPMIAIGLVPIAVAGTISFSDGRSRMTTSNATRKIHGASQ